VQSALTYAIVPAGPGDAAELARVHIEAWRETYPGMLPQAYLDGMNFAIHARRWRWRLTKGQEVTLAAETAGGLVAYASGDWSRAGAPSGEAEISTLYVLKRAQRSGVGRRLMTGAARTLAARGATSLIIWVLRENTPARRFYERMGGRCELERGEAIAGRVVPSVAYRWSEIGALTG
jgi:ribosomal protein S18 acetylase RimI-like enzyme